MGLSGSGDRTSGGTWTGTRWAPEGPQPVLRPNSCSPRWGDSPAPEDTCALGRGPGDGPPRASNHGVLLLSVFLLEEDTGLLW